MRAWPLLFFALAGLLSGATPLEQPTPARSTVYILPIRDVIAPPMVYLVRRGVKEAMEAKADLLIIDMETDGGRLDSTQEIIAILDRFPGATATFVNKKAFSAGAFISVATKQIFMAPQSVIGAAAPVMMSPGGGTEKMPDTMEVKMKSAVRALVRTSAEKNGHNVEVMEAMIDQTRELKIGDEVLNEKGQILTLTDRQAAKLYGDPPKPLLSAGTVENVDALVQRLGYAGANVRRLSPSGAEQLAFWLNAISPVLMIIGVAGIYIEFKTPGFGLPGIVGITAFALYFLGGYVAGLSGMEWIVVFVLGLILVAVEIFVYPGTVVIGLVGAGMMLAAAIMAMVDHYPGTPKLPTLPQLQLPMTNLLIAIGGSAVVLALLSRILPRTSVYRSLVSHSASGMQTEQRQMLTRSSLQGQVGTATSTLRPGGKAQFGEVIVDVMTQGDLIPKGRRVRVVGYSGTEAVVEEAGEQMAAGGP